MTKFEEKRQLGQSKLFQSQIRGQLGMPFKQFGDLRNNLDKLKTNFDLIVHGHLSLHELDMLNSDDCQMMQMSGKDRLSEQCLTKNSITHALDQEDYDELDDMDAEGIDMD